VERLSAEDVEMEDLNFYYADYSRQVRENHSVLIPIGYITT